MCPRISATNVRTLSTFAILRHTNSLVARVFKPLNSTAIDSKDILMVCLKVF